MSKGRGFVPPQTPLLAVDLIVEVGAQIVLIQRKYAPHGWALPGGFVDRGESLEQAARREAKEETGLDVDLLTCLGVYSDPVRDPRQHVVSAVFVGRATGEPQAADDAKHAALRDPHALPTPLSFDHAQILVDYLHYKKTGERPALTERV